LSECVFFFLFKLAVKSGVALPTEKENKNELKNQRRLLAVSFAPKFSFALKTEYDPFFVFVVKSIAESLLFVFFALLPSRTNHVDTTVSLRAAHRVPARRGWR
jgi:hypothetical protein